MWKYLIACVLISVSTSLLYSYYGKNEKIGVVDAVRLFNEYHMKIELEGKEKARLLYMSKQLDSLENNMKIAAATQNDAALKECSRQTDTKKREIEKEYESGNKGINELVWKRLNAVVQQFGQSKKLHLIIGANGMGTVLYNDSFYDLTEEAIAFANKKYEGGN